MMTEKLSDSESFTLQLNTFFTQFGKIDALAPLRTKSWERFQEIGLPGPKNELFKHIGLHRLYSKAFTQAEPVDLQASDIESHVLPECKGSVIVFVNGYYQPALTRLEALPNKMITTGLSEAMRTYGPLLTNQWIRLAKEDVDAFALLNGACHSEGVFIYLPPKVVCEVPLQVLYISDAVDQQAMIAPRLHLFAGANSSLNLLSTHASISGKGYCVNQVNDIALEENAHVHFTQVNSPKAEDIWHFEAVRAFLKRDSSLKTVFLTHGSAAIRNDYKVVLAGENSSASLNGVWMLREKREAYCHVLMEHRAPNCTSNQLFKGVLYDASHSSFSGKISVEQLAQKTNAFQLNNNLLLSDQATAETSPTLVIFADDVKASHGATIGQLPEEELFYMRTRGLSEAESKKVLVHGFCQQVIDLLPLTSLKLFD